MIVRRLHPLAHARIPLGLGRDCQAAFIGEPPREILPLMLQQLVLRVALAFFCLPRDLRVGVAAAPDSRSAIIYAHGITGDSIEQRAIMRDDNSDAAKTLEARDQQVARLDIKMVSRLVEHQHRRLGAERRANLPSLALTRRQSRPSSQ